MIDTEKIVGAAAGKIYQCLTEYGPVMPIPELRQKTALINYPFYEALDRLDCEKKVIIRGKVTKPEYVERRV
ncbi:MAG: hypothetical protein AB1599_06850 [Planctomycetota bacterium]